MDHFVLVWRHKDKTYELPRNAARIPHIGEEYFVLDGWYFKTDTPTNGRYLRVTAVRWKPVNAEVHIYNAPTIAYVYLHHAESYEPDHYKD